LVVSKYSGIRLLGKALIGIAFSGNILNYGFSIMAKIANGIIEKSYG